MRATIEFAQENPGMTLNDAQEYARHHPALRFLLGEDNWKSLSDFVDDAESRAGVGITEVNYRWDVFKDKKDYPRRGGKLMCAYTVSTILGLGEPTASWRDKFGSANELVTQIMRRNMEVNPKNPGICSFSTKIKYLCNNGLILYLIKFYFYY